MGTCCKGDGMGQHKVSLELLHPRPQPPFLLPFVAQGALNIVTNTVEKQFPSFYKNGFIKLLVLERGMC